MLTWSAICFVLALVAALMGFGGAAMGAAAIAKILFVVFLMASLVTLLARLAGRRG